MLHETAIYSLLNADTTLQTLVGERIYPVRPDADGEPPAEPPEDKHLPLVTYFREGTPEISRIMTGEICNTRAAIRIDIWASNFDEMAAISDAIKSGLDNFTGTTGGVRVKRVFYDGDIIEPDAGFFHAFQLWTCII